MFELNKIKLKDVLFFLYYLPMCYSSAINNANYNLPAASNQASATLNRNYNYYTNSNDNSNRNTFTNRINYDRNYNRKPNEYTQYYLNNQKEYSFNNLFNYFANYHAYIQHLYHDAKYSKIKGYNYIKRSLTDTDSLENNRTLPLYYSLNLERSSNLSFLFHSF